MAQSLPQQIKTVLQPSIFEDTLILTTTPIPTIGPDSVLVKVHSTSPCLGELTWTRLSPSDIPRDRLAVPGPDLAGTVIESPEGSAFHPGDEVYARTTASRPGNLREYTLALESELALKPRSFSFDEAAATPLSALTAYQALFKHGTLDVAALRGDSEARSRHAGLRVLITAAAGSVGGWALQFARAAGVGSVVAVCSGGKADLARALGATEVIDYTVESIPVWAAKDKAREVDLVLDCVGGDTFNQCWSAVKTGGTIITVASYVTSAPEGVDKKVAKAEFFIVESLGSQLAEITALIDSGVKLAPVIDSVVDFDDFQKAFDRVASRRAAGKVIIRVSA